MRGSASRGESREETGVDVECAGCHAWKSKEAMGVGCKSASEIESMGDLTCRECLISEIARLEGRVKDLERQVSIYAPGPSSAGSGATTREHGRGDGATSGSEAVVGGQPEEDSVAVELPDSRQLHASVAASTPLQAVHATGSDAQGSSQPPIQGRQRLGAGKGWTAVGSRRPGPDGTGIPERVETGRRKVPIAVVGDSMIYRMSQYVKCNMQGSSFSSMSGAGLEEITNQVKIETRAMDEGLVVIQGGGNSLRRLGVQETARQLIGCVEDVKRDRKGVRVAVVGVIARPKENARYEQMRKDVNRRVHEWIMSRRLETANDRKEAGVSFIDPDLFLREQSFFRDGVHLNDEGSAALGRRVRQWISGSAVCYVRRE